MLSKECMSELTAAREELSKRLRAPDHNVAGFQRGADELIKFPDGSYNDAAVIRETHFQCYHCGSVWRDTPSIRERLDESSFYVAVNPKALSENVGFNFPQWINRRLPWGKIMLQKLKAQRVLRSSGNVTPLKIWWQKCAARTWDEALTLERARRRADAYDVGTAKLGAWRLCMIVDNQLDLMTQWVMVLAVTKEGKIKQLWRGALHGLAEVRKKQLEYKDDKGNLLIKDQFVFLDGRYKPELICRHIIENKYGHWTTYNGERTWIAWNLMTGSAYEYFTHADEKDRARKFIVGDWAIREFQMDGYYVEIWSYPFSATLCGQRFDGARDWKAPKENPKEEPPIAFLDRLPDEPADDNELSHHAQIHSNKLVESKSYAPRMARLRYVPSPASAPDHYFHMWRMTMGILEIWQVDGIYQTTPV